MDLRRLTTAQVIASGTLQKNAPLSACPQCAHLTSVDEEDFDIATLRQGLKTGGLDGYFYYGYWRIWQVGTTYSGELKQYRTVTEQFTKLSFKAAFAKAQDWAFWCRR